MNETMNCTAAEAAISERERIEKETENFSTTFDMDFSIADRFGLDVIKDTFNRAFNEWKNDYRYLTALVMALNLKIWEWYGKNDCYATLYNELWEHADGYACDNLTGEELAYFFRTTD